MRINKLAGWISLLLTCSAGVAALLTREPESKRVPRAQRTQVIALSKAAGDGTGIHGVRIGKQCESPKCRSDQMTCTIELGHADSYGDTIRVIEAWDDVDPDGDDVRVPAAGNLPIVGIVGNTTCVPGGALPCEICPGGVACGGKEPISDVAGVVIFLQDQYVIQANDPAYLESQANVRVQDLCDGPGSQGCSNLLNLVQFTAASELVPCCGNNIHEADGGETCDGADAAICNSACRSPGAADACTCCGDGVLQSGEDCDDGNMVNGDGCNTSCLFECGDNDVNRSSETCDGADAETCNSTCRLAGGLNECTCCGDGIIQTGEDCDDGNDVDADGCNHDCLFACGDNDVNLPQETCDGIDAASCHRPCRTPGDDAPCTCCGDGVVNGDEDCDDGNDVNTDGCNSKCFYACGDGDINRPEETCDLEDDSVCNGACRSAGTAGECTCCGDGIVQAGEDCDDGNMVGGDGCNTSCLYECGDNDINTPAETCDGTDAAVCNSVCRTVGAADQCTCCGDGIVQAGEDCDDGNMANGDGCNTSCLFECGDNDVNTPAETCDGTDAAVCNSACRMVGAADQCTCCGDGIVQAGEDCDDGNMVGGDGCNTSCLYECGDNDINTLAETCDGTDATVCNSACRTVGAADQCTCCGDGIVQAGEDCDDGNMADGDGCNTSCLFECGDNDVNTPAETCDGTDAAVCNSPCRALGAADQCTCCGDGVVQAGEECDDGNVANGDGCNTSCQYECGDNDVNQASETCDGTDAEVCHSACRAPGQADQCTCCGDGILNGGEDCDDGNLNSVDGCNTTCTFVCGDGDVNRPEESCDLEDASVCNSACRTAGATDECTCCGDGLLQLGEECDDGNNLNGDGCNTSCLFECGDNDVNQSFETCDGTDRTGCHRACRLPGTPDQCTCCGDGVVQADEDCDDGNTDNHDGCNMKCFFACGDSAVNRPEETCDGTDAPGCNGDCRAMGQADECTCCGDGIIQTNEECDDGNQIDGDGCTDCVGDGVCGNNVVDQDTETCDGLDDMGCHRACRRPGFDDECTCCGDGIVNGDENCDDGNDVNTDGCDNKCFFKCGDGLVNMPEETCDLLDATGCNLPCRAPSVDFACTCCGDGQAQSNEECDDGNDVAGDGCSPECEMEGVNSGCSASFWVQAHHLQFWPAPYLPTDLVNDVFGITSSENPTLLKSLSTGGGGESSLLQQAVAALLNAAHPEVNYAYSPPEVILIVQAAYATGEFEKLAGDIAVQNALGCTVKKASEWRDGQSRDDSRLDKISR